MKASIILASKSPRRIAILHQLGIRFRALESSFEETKYSEDVNLNRVKRLTINNSKGKAFNIARKLKKGVIIGVDTLVLFENTIFGKPRNRNDALETLLKLNGKTHKIISGISLILKDDSITKILSANEVTYVDMRKVSRSEIQKYVDSGEPLDKAGSYGIQGKGAFLVKRIKGDYYNVVGLPVAKMFELAQKMGIELI